MLSTVFHVKHSVDQFLEPDPGPSENGADNEEPSRANVSRETFSCPQRSPREAIRIGMFHVKQNTDPAIGVLWWT